MVYIDNQSIGKDVWFDDLVVDHYESDVVEEDHYYPFGLCLNTTENTNVPQGQPYKYQGIELEKHFGLEQYETLNRTIDGQLGRIWQIDPKSEKHYDESPFASMGNNPVRNVDPLGDDWFVNNTNGEVVYLQGVTSITEESLEAMNSNNQISDYERLGEDQMFGKQVIDSKGNDVLERCVYRVGNSEAFMKGQGFDKVEKNTIEEVTYTDKSFEGGAMDGFKIETTIPASKKVLDSDISYVKSDVKKEKVEISSKSQKMEFTNTLTKTTTRYQETIPFNQSNGIKTTQNSATSNLSKSAAEKIGETIMKFFKKS